MYYYLFYTIFYLICNYYDHHSGAIECAAGLFVHYLDSFERGKNAVKDALGPASPKAQPDELSFLIRVVDTTLSVPLAITPGTDASPRNNNNAAKGAIDPNLVASLESFVLSGELTNLAGSSKSSTTPQRLLGSSHFSSLQLRFRDGYPLVVLFFSCGNFDHSYIFSYN